MIDTLEINVCGNFGYKSGELGGQTVKTRVLMEALIKRYGDNNVVFSDTSEWKRNPIALLFKVRKNFIQSKHTIILPARKGARILLPLFAYWAKKYKKDVRYVVIGGWLPNYCDRFKSILRALKVFDGIYVETYSIKQKLESLGIDKVKVMPNFRAFEMSDINLKLSMPVDYLKQNNEASEPKIPGIKAVIVTRIIKDKGIDVAINAIQALNKKICSGEEIPEEEGARVTPQGGPVVLHIYGQIYRGYQKEFDELIKNAGPNIKYMGYIEPNEVYETLNKYDIMLLPTRYDGEGFPGAVIEAFASGLPVVLSDWQYNREVIDDGKTGLIFKTDDLKDLIDKLEYLVVRPNTVREMACNCIRKAEEFHIDNVIKILLEDMKAGRK